MHASSTPVTGGTIAPPNPIFLLEPWGGPESQEASRLLVVTSMSCKEVAGEEFDSESLYCPAHPLSSPFFLLCLRFLASTPRLPHPPCTLLVLRALPTESSPCILLNGTIRVFERCPGSNHRCDRCVHALGGCTVLSLLLHLTRMRFIQS